MAYELFETGPDNRSTYADCWGSQRTSPGRLLGKEKQLSALVELVNGLSHDNWWIRGPGGRCVASGRKEFFDLPAVKNVMKWAKDSRIKEAADVR